MRILVIGGDAAGMSAASRVRKMLPESEVVVYEAGNYVSYSACGIPYYVGGKVEKFDDLLHYPVSKFEKERRIEVRTGCRVSGINTGNKTVSFGCGGKEGSDAYDTLIIATGARPIVPDLFRNACNLFTMRNLDDLKSLMNNDLEGKEVSIVGGGFVGVEMAEAFVSSKARVTLFQRSGSLLRGLDMEFSDIIRQEMEKNGVSVLMNSPVDEVTMSADGKTVVKSGDLSRSSDILFVAVGIRPNSEIVRGTDIEVDERGAIIVDRHMKTTSADVYAAGDVATTFDMITGSRIYFPLATGSNRSGRIAGYNAGGGSKEYGGVARTEVIKIFSLALGKTGLDVDEAAMEKFDPVSVTIESTSRASYYPGSSALKIKLIADRKTHRVLGCIMLGKDGVAKRTDIVAAAIYGKMTVEEMSEIDYSYSPPFAPAWEPLGVAADVLMKKL